MLKSTKAKQLMDYLNYTHRTQYVLSNHLLLKVIKKFLQLKSGSPEIKSSNSE